MVPIDACRCATWDSSAMVTLSRNLRWTRVLIVRRNHVAAAETASPTAAACTSPVRCSSTPLPSSISQRASSASGSAASWDSTNETSINRGSCRYPSLHSRHIDESGGGSGSIPPGRSGEDVIRHPFLVIGRDEPLRLQVEHRPVAPAERHQLVVSAERDDAAERAD